MKHLYLYNHTSLYFNTNNDNTSTDQPPLLRGPQSIVHSMTLYPLSVPPNVKHGRVCVYTLILASITNNVYGQASQYLYVLSYMRVYVSMNTCIYTCIYDNDNNSHWGIDDVFSHM